MSSIVFTVTAIWDEEAEVWSGSCDEVPVAADAPTREELLARICEIAVDVLGDNRPDIDLSQIEFEVAA